MSEAQTKNVAPYSTTAAGLTVLGLALWQNADMAPQGRHILATAFGVESKIAVSVCVLATLLIMYRFRANGLYLFQEATGRSANDDPDEYIMTGAMDVGLWSMIVAGIAAVAFFAGVVPPRWFLWLRAVMVIVTAILINAVLSTFLLNALFRWIYRPR